MTRWHKVKGYSANLILLSKRMFVLLAVVLCAWLIYRLLLEKFIGDGRVVTGIVLIWIFTAYFVLPRIHRLLTKLYIPDYFIGRVRTGDGLLGDPVNLAARGTKRELMKAMKAAGWVPADELSIKTVKQLFTAGILKRSYPNAPVSSLYLFGNKQDLAFQIQLNNNPRARHHVRFWKTPPGWWLPGGYKVDWLGAATFDTNVGFSLFTGQITHKIEEDTDKERDFVAATIKEHSVHAGIERIPHFMSAYHDRGGGGDTIRTDGDLVTINLR